MTTPIEIKPEIVEAAARAIFRSGFHVDEDERVVAVKWKEWVADQSRAFRQAKAALEAVAPLLVAGERAAADKLKQRPAEAKGLAEQAANLKAAFVEADIPWPNIPINHKDAHLAELLQECLDAFEVDGGDLNHASSVLAYLRDRIKWRMRGASDAVMDIVRQQSEMISYWQNIARSSGTFAEGVSSMRKAAIWECECAMPATQDMASTLLCEALEAVCDKIRAVEPKQAEK